MSGSHYPALQLILLVALEKAVRFQNGDKALFLHTNTLNQRVREGAQVAFYFNKKKKLAAVKISESRNNSLLNRLDFVPKQNSAHDFR